MLGHHFNSSSYSGVILGHEHDVASPFTNLQKKLTGLTLYFLSNILHSSSSFYFQLKTGATLKPFE